VKTILLIDGENFKNKIASVFKEAGGERPVWDQYDFKRLLEGVLAGVETDRAIFYFARIKEHSDTREKSQQLIEEQRRLKTHLERQGFEVIMAGSVRGHVERNGLLGRKLLVFREKGVDVKIAVDMVRWACDGKAERFIIGSSDSDLQSAIAEVRKRGVQCVYLGFEAQPNKGLTYTTQRTILMRNAEVLAYSNQPTR